MEIIGLSFFLIIALSFMPFIIALCRNHNDTLLIFLVVFFLGWTIIGWIIAFIWSLSSNVQGSINTSNQIQKSLTDKLNELNFLLRKKVITQEEYDIQKKKILENN